jgi:hypothetical protein
VAGFVVFAYICSSMGKRVVFAFIVIAIIAGTGWALFHFKLVKRLAIHSQQVSSNFTSTQDPEAWNRAVEIAKAERGAEGAGALEIPPELKHYEERYWFLATQVAEIEKYKVPTCQDYIDLAAMIERGEMVPVPAVTDTYVLLGVGQRADDSPFSRYEEDKELLDQSSPQSDTQQKMLPDYDSLQKLAKSFNGRSYDLNNPSDRLALKMNMLSVLRPQALKILEEVATSYKSQFVRPLPVSSLVRPEEYQHSLRRVNRNAVTIDAPPHSTGLAFDIDYRYMSVAEQNFLMQQLARIKNEGRIEVIRERNANYHVFAFMNGSRPSDDLISASLEKAGAPPPEEAHHAVEKPAKVKKKTAKATRHRGNPRATRKRRR